MGPGCYQYLPSKAFLLPSKFRGTEISDDRIGSSVLVQTGQEMWFFELAKGIGDAFIHVSVLKAAGM